MDDKQIKSEIEQAISDQCPTGLSHLVEGCIIKGEAYNLCFYSLPCQYQERYNGDKYPTLCSLKERN